MESRPATSQDSRKAVRREFIFSEEEAPTRPLEAPRVVEILERGHGRG